MAEEIIEGQKRMIGELQKSADDWRRANDMVTNLFSEASEKLKACTSQRDLAKEENNRLHAELELVKGKLEVERRSAAKRVKKHKSSRHKLKKKLSVLKAKRRADRIAAEEKSKMVGGFAATETKLRMLRQFKDGEASQWKVAKEIDVYERILAHLDRQFEEGGEERGVDEHEGEEMDDGEEEVDEGEEETGEGEGEADEGEEEAGKESSKRQDLVDLTGDTSTEGPSEARGKELVVHQTSLANFPPE